MTNSHKHRTGIEANGYKHGQAARGKASKEYRSWSGLKNRCLNPNNPKFKIYGGRGITVCERWMRFENFFADMGKKPSSLHSIERVDRNGNYELSNCIWATQYIQQRNRSTNHLVTFSGVTKTMTDFANEYGIRVGTLWNRLKLGWTIKDALTEPKWRIHRENN